MTGPGARGVLADAASPPGGEPASWRRERVSGQPVDRARWSPAAVADAVSRLAPPRLPAEALLAAWEAAIDELRDLRSPLRQALDPLLVAGLGLSPRGLAAGLELVLAGAVGEATRRLVLGAAEAGAADRSPVAVVLPANVPGLAVQPLLPALVAGRPAILRSSSREPFFAPALVAALVHHEPRLASSLLALTWEGEDPALEAAAFGDRGAVIAYGGASATGALLAHWGRRVVAFGPKLSLGIVGAAADPAAAARGLARDVALLDQRGCLSVQAVFVFGPPRPLAAALAAELAAIAHELPPGPLDPAEAVAARQVRDEATLRGLWMPPLWMPPLWMPPLSMPQPQPPLGVGTVVVEPRPELQPSPGLRTVRIHPIADLEELATALAGWGSRLQGAAVTADVAAAVTPLLARLGVSRITLPGSLQAVDAGWENGGVSLAELLARLDG